MDKKILIISMVAIAIVSAGAVAAISMNYDPEMKTASFDGIKMKVPVNAKFTKTVSGFEDTKYGISVQTFKSTDSMSNYLKSLHGAKMVSLANLPTNAVAFEQGDSTYILVTNGKEGICVGALDEDLDVQMANSVVFNDGQSNKVSKGPLGIGSKHQPKIDVDFIFIGKIIKQVNNDQFNMNNLSIAVNRSNELSNLTDDANNDNNPNNDLAVDGNPIENDNYNTVNNNATDGIGFFNSPGMELIGDLGGNSNSYDSGDMGNDIVNPNSAISDDSSNPDLKNDELTESECRELVENELPIDYSISDVNHEGECYIFDIEDEEGNFVGTVTVDAITGEITDNI
ncbi:MAG: hypothetical protein Q4P18_00350 [Methanobrevibacter sp.]|uniref:hypothetical protein n=1 Tax=Methanobrevibacter sp. TaxID=66852 RepID=UPI0026E00F12|nr:hypothetical protein [Methanobrevibacter sp.]MDO5847973.1 hypothetical protein [Methanobrevibacter sp.]